jgi:hypothetical protein
MRLAAVLAPALAAGAVGSATAAPPPDPVTLLAAGDVASCASTGDEATAALVRGRRGTIAILGDIVYDRATVDEFARCFTPSWGAFRRRTRPALGNHEYGSPAAGPARAYFRLPANGWYAYRLGSWSVVVLNSNCVHVGGCERGSPQWRWLQAALAHHGMRCTLAYWHHPRWSSGLHGSTEAMDDLWRLLADAGVDVVLGAHDHHYERFSPIDGIRSFVVGTGGASHFPVVRPIRRSEVVNWRTFGVLRLTLLPATYAWRFLPVAGERFTDAGTGRCR